MIDVLGEARSSDDMIAIFRAAKEKIGLANRHCDELAGFALGHTDKLLGPSASKNFGPLTFTGLNWLLAVKWVAVLDMDQVRVMEQYWEDHQRDASNVRLEPNRVSKKLIERAKPHVLRENGRAGGLKRASQLSAKQARVKGGKSRMRKLTKAQRSALAKAANTARWSKKSMTVQEYGEMLVATKQVILAD